MKDYRDLEGQYDKIVSVEMIEAVGHQYLDTYFRKCAQLLKPGGLMLLQAIAIIDQRYELSKRTVCFLQKYIFPGGSLPSVSAIARSVAKTIDMHIVHLEDITNHYVRTLREWRKRFFDNIDKIREMGYSDVFCRMWEFYLCYCEGGFAEHHTKDVQMMIARKNPSKKHLPGL
jgi:cyclopropane-fatty-acyl-phospholipid synthase